MGGAGQATPGGHQAEGEPKAGPAHLPPSHPVRSSVHAHMHMNDGADACAPWAFALHSSRVVAMMMMIMWTGVRVCGYGQLIADGMMRVYRGKYLEMAREAEEREAQAAVAAAAESAGSQTTEASGASSTDAAPPANAALKKGEDASRSLPPRQPKNKADKGTNRGGPHKKSTGRTAKQSDAPGEGEGGKDVTEHTQESDKLSKPKQHQRQPKGGSRPSWRPVAPKQESEEEASVPELPAQSDEQNETAEDQAPATTEPQTNEKTSLSDGSEDPKTADDADKPKTEASAPETEQETKNETPSEKSEE